MLSFLPSTVLQEGGEGGGKDKVVALTPDGQWECPVEALLFLYGQPTELGPTTGRQIQLIKAGPANPANTGPAIIHPPDAYHFL